MITSFPKQKNQHSSKLQKQPRPCFAGGTHSLVLIQDPHVLVGEEVQERNVANGLVNISHCNFFGNPGPKNKGY